MIKLLLSSIMTVMLTGCASPAIQYAHQQGVELATLNFVIKTQDIPNVFISKYELNDCEMKKTVRMGGLDRDSTQTKTEIEAGQSFTILISAFRIPIPQAYMAGWSCMQAISFLPYAGKNYELVSKLDSSGCQSELFELVQSSENKEIRTRELTQKLLPIYNHDVEEKRSPLCRQ